MPKTALALATLLAVTASACGKSPILHHETANRTAPGISDACQLQFASSGLCASVEWIDGPSTEFENSFTLRFWSAAESTPEGPYRDAPGTVAVQLWMPSMGHGSSPVTVSRSGEGTYGATRVNFIMGGAWDIRVQLKQGSQVVEQAILPVTL